MALITDPDQLNQGTEVAFDTGLSTITLGLSGNLSEDGVTGQALYSFSKEEWRNDTNLIKYTFPMLAITPEQFEFGNNGSKFSDWKLVDDNSRKLMRTAGWREYDDVGSTLREYVGVISLGNIDATSKTVGDKAYYFFVSDTGRTEFTYAGPVNEVIQIFGDAANGNFDVRSDVLSVLIRQEGKTYDASTTTDIGVSTLTYKVERFPLAEGNDLKFSVTDLDIDSNTDGVADQAPYSGMSITYIDHDNRGDWTSGSGYVAGDVVRSTSDSRWYFTASGGTSAGNDSNLAGGSDTGVTWVSYSGERQIGSTWYSFGVIVDGFNASAENIYEFVQFQLRQNLDIDAGSGTQIGLLAETLLEFVGDTLRTKQQSDGDGTFIDNFDANDTNRLEFEDDLYTTTARTFPFVAAGNISFNTNIVNDAAAQYWMFFQYATETAVADLAVTAIAGPSGGISSAASGLPLLASGDYFSLGGATSGNNNGIWRIYDSAPTSGQYDSVKVDGLTVATESAFAGTIADNPLNSPDALLVDNNSAADISGIVSGSSSVSFDFDYDGNVQGGRTAGTNALVSIRVIGLSTAQFVEAEFTITRNTGLSFPITAALERNYSNP